MRPRVHFIEQEVLGIYHVGQRIPGLGLGLGAACPKKEGQSSK